MGPGPWALAHDLIMGDLINALIIADLINVLIMADLNQHFDCQTINVLIMADLNQHFDVQTIKIKYVLSTINLKSPKLINNYIN